MKWPFLNLKQDKDKLILIGVVVCFLLSGFAALLYQTAWMRQFSVVFGTSELAVAIVLSSYMAGLALGAILAGRFVHRISRPVLVYGVLEGIIALSALSVPYLLKLSGLMYAGLLGGQATPPDASGLGQPLFYLVVAFLVLLIPTASMGATLPLLSKYVVRREDQIGSRIGMLYAVNTIGAIAGTLVAAFLLLPVFGLMGTIWVGVGINLLVFVLAVYLAKSIPQITSQDTQKPRTAINKLALNNRNPSWILPLMLLSGANTFTYEVLWTRLLSHILGGSITAFATMLASFLGGIALGSAVAARIAKSSSLSFYGFVISQAAIAISSAIIYYTLERLAPEIAVTGSNIGLTILILLPATLFIGATFPFAVRLLAHDENDAPQSSARVYGWNTLGAIAGATVAGFFLIPLLKYEGTIKLAVLVNLSLACLACLVTRSRQQLIFSSTAVMILLTWFLYKPSWPEQILRTSPIGDSRQGEIKYYDVGRTATVLMLERDGFLYLRNNGLAEATISTKGAPPNPYTARILSTLPFLARPDAREMLVIGFGGGVVVEGVAGGIQAIDVVELEPKVIKANQTIADERNINPLADPRINVYINDARNALQLTDKKYDIIVSQPSHPWTAGASHLYTREFLQLARDHLSDSGVFLQWMNGRFVSKQLLRSLCKTLLDTFPYVRVYQPFPDAMYFLGSDKPLEIEQQIALTGKPFNSDPENYLQQGLGTIEDLLSKLMMDEESVREFAMRGDIITDNFNLMATASTRLIEKGKSLAYLDLKKLTVQHSPLFDLESWVYKELPNDLNTTYIGNQFENVYAEDLKNQLIKQLYEAENPLSLPLAAATLIKTNQFHKGREALLAALKLNPDDQQSRFLLLWEYRKQLAEGTAPQLIVNELDKMTASGKAVIEVWHKSLSGDATAAYDVDSELAQAAVNDLWYLPATKLRVNWRVQYPDEARLKQYGQEALDLIDTAFSNFQDLDLFGMRVAAAFLAEKPLYMMETVRQMVWSMRDDLEHKQKEGMEIPSQMIRNNITRINSLTAGVQELLDKGVVLKYKVDDLHQQIDQLLEEYKKLEKQQS